MGKFFDWLFGVKETVVTLEEYMKSLEEASRHERTLVATPPSPSPFSDYPSDFFNYVPPHYGPVQPYHVNSYTPIRQTEQSLEEVAEKLFSRMFVMPVIVYCSYCGAGNTITNPGCVSCGAPPGKEGWKKAAVKHEAHGVVDWKT